MRRNSTRIAIETLESRRMLYGTLPAPDGDLPPVEIIQYLGRGHAAVQVMADDPNEIGDPNDRLLTPGGNIVALPAPALKGILRAIGDPND